MSIHEFLVFMNFFSSYLTENIANGVRRRVLEIFIPLNKCEMKVEKAFVGTRIAKMTRRFRMFLPHLLNFLPKPTDMALATCNLQLELILTKDG